MQSSKEKGRNLLMCKFIVSGASPQGWIIIITLDEWSARRKDLYLHRTTQQTNIHAPSGIRTRDRRPTP
jgi:hypothetical protein